MDLAGQKVVVIGAAKSGQAAARLIAAAGGQVKLSDNRPEKEVDEGFRGWLKEKKFPTEFGEHTREFIQDSDVAVTSPGVRINAQPVIWAKEKGIQVIGEIELAARMCPCPIIAVTGSNGKTTVSTLIHKILQEAGRTAFLCGNVGSPFAAHVQEMKPSDFAVLEVSSFQLETIVTFKPHVAVFLNFSQNHLDRHRDIEEYFEAKKRIFVNQDQSDFAVLNADDARVRGLSAQLKAKVALFNTPRQRTQGKYANPNCLAALTVTALLGIRPEAGHRVFEGFGGVEHRLEKVRTIDGVDFINDSKATTAEAGRWALENIRQPVVMICGGRDKNIDFTVLKNLVKEKVKRMIAIGEARSKLKDAFAGVVDFEEGGSLEEAVRIARQKAVSGDCVLLSPMCASFDMFKNFEERGKAFKEIVARLNPSHDQAVK